MTPSPTEPGNTTRRVLAGLRQASDILWLAAATAVVVGLAHVAVTEVRLHLLRQFTWTSRHILWMSPLGYFLCLTALALPLALVQLAVPRTVVFRVSAIAMLSTGALALVLLEQSVHPAAQVILALGAGVQGARLLERRSDPGRVVRRIARWGGAGVLACGGVAALWLVVRDAWTSRARRDDSDAPNVLMIIWDTVRASSMSLYGYSRNTTPVLDRLARESTVFDAAISTSPWSLPSHASMLTGLWPRQTKGDFLTPVAKGLPTVTERLRASGYRTAAFSANTGYLNHETGLQRGFTRFDDFRVNLHQVLLSTTLMQTGSGQQLVTAVRQRERWRIRAALTRPNLRISGIHMADHRSAGDVAGRFIRWRDQQPSGPYFALLNFMDAHGPYQPPDGFASRFGDSTDERTRYDGAIAYLDSIVGTLLDELRRRGDLDRTILLITSDHGELFGENGLSGHRTTMLYPLMHVPLVLRAPNRVPAGRRISQVVSLRDLPATILELTRRQPTLPGASLAKTWAVPAGATSLALIENEKGVNLPPDHPASWGPMEGVIDSLWHYVRLGNGREMLYAWRTDSLAQDDRSSTPAGQRVIANLRRRMGEALRSGAPAVPDSAP